MSYSLNFIKKQDLTIQQSLSVLAKQKASKEFQFSDTELEKIIAEITDMNQHVSINKEKNNTEIDFENFKINLDNSQFLISIPFSKDNLAQKILVQVNSIIYIFLESDCIGIDPQIETFVDDDYSFKTAYSESLQVVTASEDNIDEKAPMFETAADAEKYYAKKKEEMFALVEPLKAEFSTRKLDFSPESLKHLEWMFYNSLDNEKFGKGIATKEQFYELLSYYKAKVYVEHKLYEWKIIKNFHQQNFQLAVQKLKGMHTIFIAPKKNFEDFPDKKKETLLKEYSRDL